MKKGRLKKLLYVVSAAVLTIAVSVGTTVSTVTDAEEKENNFSVASASLTVTEPLWENLEDEDKVLYPGKKIVKDPTIINNGEVSLYVYARVQVPVKTVRTVSEDGTEIIESAAHPLFTYEINDGWALLASSQSSSVSTAEYVYAGGSVAPGESAPPIFDSVTFLNVLEGELPQDTQLEIVVYGVGIQSDYVTGGGSASFDQLRSIYFNNRTQLLLAGIKAYMGGS